MEPRKDHNNESHPPPQNLPAGYPAPVYPSPGYPLPGFPPLSYPPFYGTMQGNYGPQYGSPSMFQPGFPYSLNAPYGIPYAPSYPLNSLHWHPHAQNMPRPTHPIGQDETGQVKQYMSPTFSGSNLGMPARKYGGEECKEGISACVSQRNSPHDVTFSTTSPNDVVISPYDVHGSQRQNSHTPDVVGSPFNVVRMPDTSYSVADLATTIYDKGENKEKFQGSDHCDYAQVSVIEDRKISAQVKHIDLERVHRYKKYGLIPEGVKDKANFRRQSKSYFFENSQLWHRTQRQGRQKITRAIIDRKDRIRLISLEHEGDKCSKEAQALSSHKGRDAVIGNLCAKYYWPGMTEDIKEYCRTCRVCQEVNPSALKVVPEMRPVAMSADVMKQVGVDIVQMKESSDGMRYLIVLIDYHSKWSEALPVKNKTAATVARFLYSVICRHSCFKIQINDQGREFVNCVSDELHRLCGVRQRITSAYHPQANGLVERQNQTICRFLVKTLEDERNAVEWPECVEGALFAHRTMKHKSTKFSPFFVIYGREPVLPSHVDQDHEDGYAGEPPAGPSNGESLILEEGDDFSPFDVEEFRSRFDAIISVRQAIDKVVHENIKDAQNKQKLDYDRRHVTANVWNVGDKVMIENMRKKERKGGKMEKSRTAGYEILKVDSHKNCTLRNLKTGLILKTKYPAVQLIPFRERSLPAFMELDGELLKAKSNMPCSTQKGDGNGSTRTKDDIVIIGTEERSMFYFPVGFEWQVSHTKDLELKVKVPLPSSCAEPVPLTKNVENTSIQSDGNCWFRAISKVLTGSEDNHKKLRKIVCSYMLGEKRNALEAFAASPNYFDNWNMEKDCQWATDVEIMGTAALLDTDIYVLTNFDQQNRISWQFFDRKVLSTYSEKTLNKDYHKQRPSTVERSIYISNPGNHFEVITGLRY